LNAKLGDKSLVTVSLMLWFDWWNKKTTTRTESWGWVKKWSE